jgi:biotin carboxylase
VTDWSTDAPARADADHFEPIDLKDYDRTLALAADAHIEGVLTAADIGVPTAASITEQLGLPGYGRDIAEWATNKFSMRERARAVGITGPWYRRVRSASDARASIAADAYPVIVKPVDNCSSRGVRWVKSADELAPAVDDALANSRSGDALVEEALVGTEGSIEALVQDGRAIVLGICDKTKSPLPDRFDLELRYPGRFAPAVWQQLESLPQRIASGFGLMDGVLHIEFIVAHDNAVSLIEFAVRGCGSKVLTHLMPVLTGVDIVRVLVRQAFGLPTRVEPLGGRHGALQFLMFPRGCVAAVHGVDEARQLPHVIDACVERTPGERIDEVHDGRSRPGHVLVHGRDRADVQETLRHVRRLVRLEYQDGTSARPLPIEDPRN